MKYAKPNEAIEGLRFHCRNDSPTSQGLALLKWIDSLPAEFEIVEPGMTQVRWPEGCTRAALESDAKYIYYRLDTESSTKVEVHLKALAAIAPVEKKKRRVEIWKHVSGRMEAWEVPLDPRANVFGWHRVETATPIEIDD